MATVELNADQSAPAAPMVSLPIFSGTTYSRCADELDARRAQGLHTSLKRKVVGAARYVRGGHFRQQLLDRKPLRVKLNEWKNGFSAALGLRTSLGQPVHLTIEPTNVCDQKCPICETGNGTLGRRKQMLSYDDFRRILDQFPHAHTLFLYFMGEPFLNKDVYRMIRYATDRGVWVTTCTDGNFVDADALVESGLGEIQFQISGMTQEMHEVYRIGGQLHKALNSLERAIELKNRPGSPNPNLRVVAGFILFRHNEHQAAEFIEYCKSTGVDQHNIIGTCLRTAADQHLLPSDRKYWYYDEQALAEGRLVPKVRPNDYCGWLYSAVNILVNGDLVSCCRDPRGENILGNCLETPFAEIWNNQRYQAVRANVALRSNELSLCSLCTGEALAPEPPVSLTVRTARAA